MDKTELEVLIKEAVRDADLHPRDIPAIDLYLDQITSLMNDKLKEGSQRFHGRVLTKTMINNYSKDGLISPVKGKKYTKEQILQMLLVYELKNTLSIGEIKRILQSVYALPSFDGNMLEQTYLRFLEIKDIERAQLPDLIQAFIRDNGLDTQNDADFFVTILGLAAMSSYLKNTVQALLEARYSDPDAEKEREEQERREEAKRQKEEKKAAKSAKKEESAVDSSKNDGAEGAASV